MVNLKGKITLCVCESHDGKLLTDLYPDRVLKLKPEYTPEEFVKEFKKVDFNGHKKTFVLDSI